MARSAMILIYALLFLNAGVVWAFAYIGPGAGLSAIGSFVALAVALIAAVFGFLWYPIKRILRSRKKKKENTQNTESTN